MANLTLPFGDYGYNINFTVQDSAGGVYSLVGYVTTFKAWDKKYALSLAFSKVCVPDVPASGTCHLALLIADIIPAGSYTFELELTKAGVVESTESYDLEVVESG